MAEPLEENNCDPKSAPRRILNRTLHWATAHTRVQPEPHPEPHACHPTPTLARLRRRFWACLQQRGRCPRAQPWPTTGDGVTEGEGGVSGEPPQEWTSEVRKRTNATPGSRSLAQSRYSGGGSTPSPPTLLLLSCFMLKTWTPQSTRRHPGREGGPRLAP